MIDNGSHAVTLFRSFGHLTRADQCAAALCTAFFVLLAGSVQVGGQTVTNGSISVSVACSSNSIQLTGISAGGFSYVGPSAPSHLLSFSLNDFAGPNYYKGTFSRVSCNLSGEILTITANSSDGLAFSFTLAPDGTNPVVIVTTQVTYTGGTSGSPAPTAFFRAMLPDIQAFAIPNSPDLPGKAMAMVPKMIGTVLPLSQVSSSPSEGGLGAPYGYGNAKVKPSVLGLPTSLNVMEIAAVYDGGGGGGLFFMDLDGDYAENIAPLQFNLTNSGSGYLIAGYWTALLKLGQTVTLPRLAIGVHPSGDWHNAVDYYVSSRSPAWTFPPDIPSWFRNAGGIYSLGVAGGGSFLNAFPDASIEDANFGIKSFDCSKPGRCLDDVFKDAQALGSNVIYLTTWYESPSPTSRDFYDNKGDWVVRSDLGGASRLKRAVKSVHVKGGRVILYMDAYIAAFTSKLVTSGSGDSWQGVPAQPIQPPDVPAEICMYSRHNDCMAIPDTQWQDYLISRAVDLVESTGVDGFFLDSYGFQMNWPVGTTAEHVDYTSQQWTAAALRFIDRLRTRVREKNSDAIVMGENNGGQLPFHWDGGSATDLAWGSAFTQSNGILGASPIRYAMPNANFFVNGGTLGSVNQAIASGHNLALGPFWLLQVGSGSKPFKGKPTRDPAVSKYIRSLLKIRTTYTDALISGRQVAMPATSSPDVVAFLYQGGKDQILAIVNNGTNAVSSVTVTLPTSYGTGAWTSLMPSSLRTITESASGVVSLGTMRHAPTAASDPIMGALVILQRSCPLPTCGSPDAYGPTLEAPLMNEDFSNGLANWTDWMVSGGKPVASGEWSSSPGAYPRPATLQAQSRYATSLLFYDLFGGGDFTYSAGIALDTFSYFGVASAGLSFRLSDSPQRRDAGHQGYDVLLTTEPFSGIPVPHYPPLPLPPEGPYPFPPPSPDPGPLVRPRPDPAGSIMLVKRPFGKILAAAAINITTGQFYAVSVSTKTTWTKNSPSSTDFTVYVDGIKKLSFTDTDAPYFSGRFGVNASYANARFICLQATSPEAPALPPCVPRPHLPAPIPLAH